MVSSMWGLHFPGRLTICYPSSPKDFFYLIRQKVSSWSSWKTQKSTECTMFSSPAVVFIASPPPPLFRSSSCQAQLALGEHTKGESDRFRSSRGCLAQRSFRIIPYDEMLFSSGNRRLFCLFSQSLVDMYRLRDLWVKRHMYTHH